MNGKELIFLKPVFKETIWGGKKLRDVFNYGTPSEQTGECWAIAAHENGDCVAWGGSYDGMSLSRLWREKRELFGPYETEVFPLLIKIIDAKTDLSIQVHPDDTYARSHENGSLGKTECWYVLDAKRDGRIIVGHRAKSKAETKKMIAEKKWAELLNEIPVKAGDFFQINPGSVHAIKEGTLIFEVQENSDITYRLYDYDRLYGGKKRPLHLEKSLDVIRYPNPIVGPVHELQKTGAGTIDRLYACAHYTVEKIDVTGGAIFGEVPCFSTWSLIEGQGTVNEIPVEKGAHFIVPAACEKLEVTGKFTALRTTCPCGEASSLAQ